ncbi:putative redox protein [Mumia flava]|uniref:Putative redox protein n=1 Tax=Mumia flava TaxID=1348852 RepID=A0A0B2B6M8_9ACTN|nr:OsmC family protein [Mumia flava]PJJ53968.1 putative redox protein [Mumia flava]
MSDQNAASANRDVVVRSLDNFASVATIGGEHSVVIDEPREFAGDGAAPNPFGLILSALGGCIAGTLRGVARQHDFDYADASVRLSLRVNRPTKGPLDPGERELRISRVMADVTITGSLTEEQQGLLRHGVETCPVGNTLRRSLNLVETVTFKG